MKLVRHETLFQNLKVRLGIETRPVLQLIHIGKCGGRSLIKAIEDSPIVARKYRAFKRTHVRTPNYQTDEHFLFIIRNPISRAISAFNWRYHLIVGEGRNADKHPNERAILLRYGSIDALALSLYVDGQLNEVAASEYKEIGHLFHGIAEYLEGVSDIADPAQIVGILCQETLDDDMQNYLGIASHGRVRHHFNGNKAPTVLSADSRRNLASFLEPEYKAIEELLSLYPLDEERRNILLAR